MRRSPTAGSGSAVGSHTRPSAAAIAKEPAPNVLEGGYAGRPTGFALVRAYYDLAKPRLLLMVLVTTLAGYYLGLAGGEHFNYLIALHLMVGTAVAAAGTLALNQYFERDLDARMFRTRRRPLPSGRLSAAQALRFGVLATVAGLAYLWIFNGVLTAIITAAITIVYLWGYTPLKRISPVCSVVGAIPGALPPVAGWAAARGALGAEPLVLFTLMFLWQLPHSLAIAQLYRADYLRAGFRLLATEDPDGRSTGRQIVLNTALLAGVGMLPTFMGFAGRFYFVAALIAALVFLYYGIRLALSPQAVGAARRVMFASLVYLPLIMLLLVFDKI